MADFRQAYTLTMGHEGGYADNKADHGGMTYKGIARNFHPDWSGWKQVNEALDLWPNVTAINKRLALDADLQQNVQDFYEVNYWNTNRLNALINQQVANEVFDIGVNSGVGTAARTLQEALNLTNVNGRAYPDIQVDGKIGPTTLQLLNAHPRPALLIKVINALQAERYIKIMRANPTQEIFAASWFSRV